MQGRVRCGKRDLVAQNATISSEWSIVQGRLPSYSVKPSFLNLFRTKFIRERVVPIIRGQKPSGAGVSVMACPRQEQDDADRSDQKRDIGRHKLKAVHGSLHDGPSFVAPPVIAEAFVRSRPSSRAYRSPTRKPGSLTIFL
jgi:hypothetical protein